MRQAVLVRVGIDSTYGGWQAPVNPCTREFAYVPIPEDEGMKDGVKKKPIREAEGCRITYDQFIEPCNKVGTNLPSSLLKQGKYAHLDPDFEYLTYGEEGRKGQRLRNLELSDGDLLVFYSALRPINDNRPGQLWYSIIGFYELDHIEDARNMKDPVKDVPMEQWKVNAHWRRQPRHDDIVVFGKEGKSGRLDKCIPIGEYQGGKYFTKMELCPYWDEPNHIYIQRSGSLPKLKNPKRFYEWLKMEMEKWNIRLNKRNNLDSNHIGRVGQPHK